MNDPIIRQREQDETPPKSDVPPVAKRSPDEKQTGENIDLSKSSGLPSLDVARGSAGNVHPFTRARMRH